LPTKVLIAIQARSGSTRLPRKAFELIGERRMLDHVVDACRGAAYYLNSRTQRAQQVRSERGGDSAANASDISVAVALLVPTGDPIAKEFGRGTAIVEGPEHDVLARYYAALERHTPDYVVRITGDCPLIPDFLIAKHITTAIKGRYDYVSNVDEETRTAIDGHDCEVVSARLLGWLHGAAEEAGDREHVTLMARREPPDWAVRGAVLNYHDQSHVKLSVDTPEDLARVRDEYNRRDAKVYRAERKFGKMSVHRL
jgi:spore coat polysaccharide biosynthesis protein SpsF (cytidylyltransferase family)